jgi:hypothetical protein
MKAIEVIRIGRKRRRQASSVASIRSLPCSCSSRANSMIRIAFFAERPMMAIRPTLKYTSLGRPRRSRPAPRRRCPAAPPASPRRESTSFVQRGEAQEDHDQRDANRKGAWVPESVPRRRCPTTRSRCRAAAWRRRPPSPAWPRRWNGPGRHCRRSSSKAGRCSGRAWAADDPGAVAISASGIISPARSSPAGAAGPRACAGVGSACICTRRMRPSRTKSLM